MHILALNHTVYCRQFDLSVRLLGLILGLSWLIGISIALISKSVAGSSSPVNEASSSGIQQCARMRFTLSLSIARFNPEPTVTCSTLCHTKFTEFDREMERRLDLVSQSILKVSRAFSGDEAKFMTPFSSIPFMDDCEAVPSACHGEKLAFTEVDMSYADQQSSASCSDQKQSASTCSSTRLLSCNCRIVLVLPLVHCVAEPTNWKFGPAVHFNKVSCSAQAIVARLNEKSQILGWQTVLGDPPGNIHPRNCSEVAEPDKQTCRCIGGGQNCLRQLTFTPDQIHGPMTHNLDFHRLVRLSEYNNIFLADYEKLQSASQLPTHRIEPPHLSLIDVPYYFASEAAILEPLEVSSADPISGMSNLDSFLRFQEGPVIGTAPWLRVPPHTIGPPFLFAHGHNHSALKDLTRINQLLMVIWKSNQMRSVLTEVLVKVSIHMQRAMDAAGVEERTRTDLTLGEDNTGNPEWAEDVHNWIASDEDTDRDSPSDFLGNAVRAINRIFRRAHRVDNHLKISTLDHRLFDCMVRALEKKLRKGFPSYFIPPPVPEPPAIDPNAATNIHAPEETDSDWPEDLHFL